MELTKILSEIDAEISRLQQAKAILAGETVTRGPGRPKTAPAKKKRNLTPEGRARIAATVKARWAKQKKS
jgi:mono/diheme cytochrome c family protein